MNKTIKSLLLGFLAVSLISSCADNTQNPNNQAVLANLQQEIQAFKTEKSTLERNKKVVTNFYQEFFGDKDLSAAEKYIGDVYIQHNPAVADGKEPLVEAAKTWFKDSKDKEKINFLNVVAEGDLVFVQIGDKYPNGDKSMVIDVFRVTDGKITEHWDAFANFKKGDKSANDNPLF